jgi:DNA-binding transcriptional LysR family regulator
VITLRQLQVFAQVAEAGGSVTQAAANLDVSQPSVSDTLRTLEHSLGTKLLAGRGLARGLTAAGETYQAYAARIVSLVAEGRQALADLHGTVSGQLRLVAVPTAGEHLVPAALRPFVQRYPEVEISLRVANRAAAIGPLSDGWADLAVMGRPPANVPLEAQAFLPNRLILACAPEHPLAGGTSDLGKVAEATMLIREPGSGTRAAVEQVFASAGLDLRRTLEIGSNAAVIAALHERLGISVLPEIAIANDLAAGHLVSVDAPGFPLEREWHILRRADAYLSAPAKAFIEQLTTCTIDAHGAVSTGSPSGLRRQESNLRHQE